MHVLGIDIGGSGIKGAPVCTQTGELKAERFRIETPDLATPETVVACAAQVVAQFAWKGPIGVGFPGVVRHGVTYTAANLDRGWVGFDLAKALSAKTGCPVAALNDADAAGLAEVRFGSKDMLSGVVILVTLGTGIGTAVICNGVLVPNAELGHLYNEDGTDWEKLASEAAKERDDMKWGEWGTKRLNPYLHDLCALMNPDMIIIGGGAVRKFEKYVDKLDLGIPVVEATMKNLAGIVGAALYAEQTLPAPVAS